VPIGGDLVRPPARRRSATARLRHIAAAEPGNYDKNTPLPARQRASSALLSNRATGHRCDRPVVVALHSGSLRCWSITARDAASLGDVR